MPALLVPERRRYPRRRPRPAPKAGARPVSADQKEKTEPDSRKLHFRGGWAGRAGPKLADRSKAVGLLMVTVATRIYYCSQNDESTYNVKIVP